MQDGTRSHPRTIRCDDTLMPRAAGPVLSADAQAWAAFILAEAFPAGRNVAAAARRVPLRVAALKEADIFDPEATITVQTYLHYLRYLCVNSACDCPVVWCACRLAACVCFDADDQTCAHLVAMVRQEMLPVLPPLYAAAVAAAVGEVWPPLAAPETSDHQEEETADDKEAAGQRTLEP